MAPAPSSSTAYRAASALALLAAASHAQVPTWSITGASSRRTYRGPNPGPIFPTGVAWQTKLGNATAYPIGPVIDGAGVSYFVLASLENNGHSPQSGPAVDLVAVSPTGALLWTTAGLGCNFATSPTCTLASPSAATISGNGSTVYVQVDFSAPGGGSRPVVLPGSVFAFNAATGAQLWAAATAGAFFADNAMPISEFDGTVLAVAEIPNPGGGFPWSEVVAYGSSGAPAWKFRVNAADFSAVAVVPLSGTVILWPGFGVMTALSGGASGGSILWQQNVTVGVDPRGGGRGGVMMAISEDGSSIIASFTNAPFIVWVSVATGATVLNQSVPGMGGFGYADFKRQLGALFKVSEISKKDMTAKTRGPQMRVAVLKISRLITEKDNELLNSVPVGQD